MAGTQGSNEGINRDHLPALSSSAEEFLKYKYDFLVVGGGTAGLCIAARLTENPDTVVGVLEAGKSRLGDMLVDTPAMFLQMSNNEEYDYGFMSEPQEGNKGKRHNILRGKGLGGSSMINYLMYVRGSDQDYDDWATIVDDQSWSSREMKRYMRKHQTLEPIADGVINTTPFVGSNHGTSGPIKTSFNDWRLPIEDDWIKACEEVTGYTSKPVDPWSGDHIGFYNTLGLVSRTGPDKGKRSYAGKAYFEANAHRPNLHVLCEANVSSVELHDNKAVGVHFYHGGVQHTSKVQPEIILAAGAFQSPQILELSGIGDPEVLTAAGVKCKVVNEGVGNNLQEHVFSAVGYELKPGVDSLEAIYRPEVMADAQKLLVEKQGGPLTCISSSQGFFPYKIFASETEQNAIQEAIKTTSNITPFQERQYARIQDNLRSDRSANIQTAFMGTRLDFAAGLEDHSVLFPPPTNPDEPNNVVFATLLQYPLSRGSVHIRSPDLYEQPAIDPAFLKHPADVEVLATSMKFLDNVAKSSALASKLAKRTHPAPDLDLQNLEEAKNAVLDTRLRVKGVRGLRVVDASVFPGNVSGNIISSVYAVAEKAADIIKADLEYAALAT